MNQSFGSLGFFFVYHQKFAFWHSRLRTVLLELNQVSVDTNILHKQIYDVCVSTRGIEEN
jgi:hypothetical protein